MGLNQDETTILSVSFQDPAWLEVTFLENDTVLPGRKVQRINTLRIDPNLGTVADDIDAILSNLRDIVQAALIEDRGPAHSFTRQ